MEKNWKKGIARDVMALGSIPFYFIVIIRAIIGKYAIFVYQLLIAAIILFLLMKIFGNPMRILQEVLSLWFSQAYFIEIIYIQLSLFYCGFLCLYLDFI